MIQKVETLVMAVLLMAASCTLGRGQVTPAAILEIDVENYVSYNEDTSDLSKFATDPNSTTAGLARGFFFGVQIADIVAVNGQPANDSQLASA